MQSTLRRISPHVPQVRPHGFDGIFPQGSFELHGPQQMDDFFLSAIRALSSADQGVLREHSLRMAEHTPVVGTVCSGTDAPILVLRSFSRAISRAYSVRSRFEHAWSCERDAAKRSFLRNMFEGEVRYIFADAIQLGFCDCVEDTLTKSLVRLSDNLVDELFGGFPCQDVSFLNCHNRQNRTVVRDSTQRTGAVYHGIVKYLRRHRDRISCVLLENVRGLMARPSRKSSSDRNDSDDFSNLDHCVHLLNQEGFWVYVALLDPRFFGCPVSRERVWMLAMPREKITAVGMTEADMDQVASRVIGAITTCQVPNSEIRTVRNHMDHI